MPVAVGGEARGVLTSVSPEAARFGVQTAMPTDRARRLCPKLVVLPGDYEKYEQFSSWMFACVHDFASQVEMTNLDAGYFDLSGARLPPPDIAARVRGIIGQSLKISVSEGMASSKLVSQIAAKLSGPERLRVVPAGGRQFF